jgi:hypothetical protein
MGRKNPSHAYEQKMFDGSKVDGSTNPTAPGPAVVELGVGSVLDYISRAVPWEGSSEYRQALTFTDGVIWRDFLINLSIRYKRGD